MRATVLFVALLGATASMSGCGDDATPTPTGEIVAGVTSDVATIARLEVVKTVDGKASGPEELRPVEFPMEVPVADLADGADVRFDFSAFAASGDLLVSRAAATRAKGGEKLLLPVALEASCVDGTSTAPTCPADQTCIAGACSDPFVDTAELPPYNPNWAGGSGADICKPEGSTPEVRVGQGQSDYLPLDDLEEVQVEAGPQGGYHVWIAVRMRGLLRSGSITSVSGRVEELDYDVAPFNIIFTFDQDEGGFCKLYGLRFRLDGAQEIDALLGKQLDVTVTITDEDEDVGVGTKSVMLSSDIIGQM